MIRKFFLLILLLIVLPLCFFGCQCSKNSNKNNIANIPFEILDQNDFTLEKVAKEVKEPMVVALDSQELLDNLYKKIRKNNSDKNLTINSNDDLVVIVLRGSNGICKQAGIDIEKISREDKKIKVEITIDNSSKDNQQDCSLLMNPYSLIKIKKEKINYSKDLKIELINSENKKVLNTAEINNLPGLLK